MRRVLLLFLVFVLASLTFAATARARGWVGNEEEPDEQLLVYINLWERKLYFMRKDQILKSYPIGPGTSNTPTPVGQFVIVQKSTNWGGGFGSRWLGLNVPFGVYGIHGTNKPHLIGRQVSRGCIRMKNRDIEELYSLAPVRTPVWIDGPILGAEGLNFRVLVRGSRGSLVLIVQNHLQAGGYYRGKCNGIFDRHTEVAVEKYQADHGLPVTGQIHFVDLVELGLVE